MPRTVTVSLPSERADRLLEELDQVQVLTLHRLGSASLQPRGDVVEVQVLDRDVPALMALLERVGAGEDDEVSVSTSEPTGLLSSSAARDINTDVASSSLEEMHFMIQRESAMGWNKVMVMAVSGAVAVAGLATDAVHLVIGAMVIAPGFEPLMRVTLGLAGRNAAWRHGLLDTAKGYGALVLGALATALVLPLVGTPVPSSGSYLPRGVLLDYWLTITPAATYVAVVAGLGGALLIAANRSVLTAGIMIALGLVPGAALIGIGIAGADAPTVLGGVQRWAHDAALVLVASLAVFGAKAASRGRRLQQ